MKILLLNGPNLNMLGKREPAYYGTQTLQDIEHHITDLAKQAHFSCECFQSNSEEKLIDKIQQSLGQVDFILFNPAGFTHTSIALRDALIAVDIPFVEIHLSNIHRRESFRQLSYFSDIAEGVICGLGAKGYELAFYFVQDFLKTR